MTRPATCQAFFILWNGPDRTRKGLGAQVLGLLFAIGHPLGLLPRFGVLVVAFDLFGYPQKDT